MKMRSVTPMRIAKIGYVIMSILFCVAGILFIVRPEMSTKIMGICIGVAMILFGVVKLVGYFSKDLFRLAFQFDLEFGILMAVLGIIVLLDAENLMAFISVALGISILLDGLFKIRIAMDAKQFGIGSWWLILALAIVTGAVGAVLVFDSVFGAKVLSVLLGISFLSEGILNLCTVISTVLIVKNQLPDVIIEAEGFETTEQDE